MSGVFIPGYLPEHLFIEILVLNLLEGKRLEFLCQIVVMLKYLVGALYDNELIIIYALENHENQIFTLT